MQIPSQSLSPVDLSRIYFSTWNEFVENVSAMPLSHMRRNGKSRTVESAKGWSGAATFEDAIHRARTGDSQLTFTLQTAISRVMEQYTPAPESKMYLDVTTDYGWDMGTAITGNPQAGINFHSVAGESKKLVRIVLNITDSSKTDKGVFTYRGAIAYLLYTLLTERGYDVALDGYVCIANMYRNPATALIGVNILSPGETPDLGVLAYALMSASVLRRLYFSLIDTLGTYETFCQYGPNRSYGYPANLPQAIRGDINIDLSSRDSLVDTPESYASLLADAERMVEAWEKLEAGA